MRHVLSHANIFFHSFLYFLRNFPSYPQRQSSVRQFEMYKKNIFYCKICPSMSEICQGFCRYLKLPDQTLNGWDIKVSVIVEIMKSWNHEIVKSWECEMYPTLSEIYPGFHRYLKLPDRTTNGWDNENVPLTPHFKLVCAWCVCLCILKDSPVKETKFYFKQTVFLEVTSVDGVY